VEPQMDMQQLFAAAQQMQEQLMHAQQALADAEVTGTAGGGLVKATVNGQGELLDISISPAAVDPADAEETARTIADLVLAAVRDAYRSAEDLQQQQMGPFAAAMQGAGLPGMPGMPGGLDLPSGLDLSGLGLGGPAVQGAAEPYDEDDEDDEDEDDDEDDDDDEET
jgi:nucleoid-associated protein EbfC